MNDFKVNYVTTLPKEGNAPRLEIKGNEKNKYNVYFFEKINSSQEYELYTSGTCFTNQTFIGPCKQWYTNWFIQVTDMNNQIVHTDRFQCRDYLYFRIIVYRIAVKPLGI